MQIILMAASAAEIFKNLGFLIVALLALMIMIVLHELGHYTAGKLLGFRIDEFSVGFGPALFKHKSKKTNEVFSIRLLPLGGFCAFHGEDADGALLDEKGDQIRDENGEIVKDPEAFNNQKAWKRLIVQFAGAFMNFLSAIIIIAIYFTAYGQILPSVIGTHQIEGGQAFAEGDIILNIDGKQTNIVDQTDVDNAFSGLSDSITFRVLRDGKRIKIVAHKAYYSPFEDGDFITEIDGQALDTPIAYAALGNYIDVEDGKFVDLTTVQYDGNGQLVSQSTVSVARGVVSSDMDGFYSYGFGITRSLARQKLPFWLAFGRSFGFSFYIVFKILASLGALITGKLGLEAAGGTITTIGTIAKVSSSGFDMFLYAVAVISANLAVMNLLPFPALDGSRMLFTLIEIIFRKPVPRKIEAIIHTVGLVLLLVLAVFLDIFHLVHR